MLSDCGNREVSWLEAALDRGLADAESPAAWLASLLAELAKHSGVPEKERDLTWLLRATLEAREEEEPLSVGDSDPILRHLPTSDSWEARLHTLQLLRHLSIGARRRASVEGFVRESLTSKNKFERAWAYDAFHFLATRFSELRPEWSELLAAAESEPPSVRARLRHLPSAF